MPLFKQNAFFGLVLVAVMLLAGCASHDTRFKQCARASFYDCLGVGAEQCDANFLKAKQSCEQAQQGNSMFENMPDSMKEGYLNRCMVDTVVKQSGLDEDKTKECLRW